ncbi:MAG: HAMP domain-containing protein [Deltaproteobacteria bacterium]|nr:HAMP domain-containing protein [Deltaproteobacteria bacterium]
MADTRYIPIKRKIFLSHFLAVIIVSGSIGTFFYFSAVSNLMDAIRSRLLNSAALVSRGINAADLENIRKKDDIELPEYRRMIRQLLTIKQTNRDIAFLYVMRRDGDKVVFVMDTDESPKRALPGQPYPSAPEELLQGFTRFAVDKKIYTDEWGAFMSGYAPLPDGGGRYLVGIDMRADEVRQKLHRLRMTGVISLGCSVLLAFLFSHLLGSHLVRRIELLTLQCRAIAEGQVGEQLDYRKGDELDSLIQAFNTMSDELASSRGQTEQSRQALESSRNELEVKVRERTRDLGRLNDQLTKEIADRTQVQEANATLIARLQETLSQVKTLQGFLPICASCKRIRDDKGYWNQIEIYLREHTDTEFSHSICPECAEKLYGQYLK